VALKNCNNSAALSRTTESQAGLQRGEILVTQLFIFGFVGLGMGLLSLDLVGHGASSDFFVLFVTFCYGVVLSELEFFHDSNEEATGVGTIAISVLRYTDTTHLQR
jgi:hypothetical protein